MAFDNMFFRKTGYVNKQTNKQDNLSTLAKFDACKQTNVGEKYRSPWGSQGSHFDVYRENKILQL
jgi:hypothetical protein